MCDAAHAHPGQPPSCPLRCTISPETDAQPVPLRPRLEVSPHRLTQSHFPPFPVRICSPPLIVAMCAPLSQVGGSSFAVSIQLFKDLPLLWGFESILEARWPRFNYPWKEALQIRCSGVGPLLLAAPLSGWKTQAVPILAASLGLCSELSPRRSRAA